MWRCKIQTKEGAKGWWKGMRLQRSSSSNDYGMVDAHRLDSLKTSEHIGTRG